LIKKRGLKNHQKPEKSENFAKKLKKREFSEFIEKKPCRKRLCFWSDRGLYTFIEFY
jgi:hypothetical protein